MCGVQPWCVLKGTRILLLGGVLSKGLPGPTGRWRRSHPDLHWFSVRLSYRFLLPLVDLSAPSCCMCLRGQLLGAEVTKIVISSLWIYHYKVPFFIPVNSPYSEAALFIVNKVTAAFFWRALACVRFHSCTFTLSFVFPQKTCFCRRHTVRSCPIGVNSFSLFVVMFR